MDIRKLRKLFLLVIGTSILLMQISQAYLAHVDVLAKIIQMSDGTEKVDVAIVGGDFHDMGTVENDWRLFFDLAERLDPKGNIIEMFIEAMTASSYTRTFPEKLKECTDKVMFDTYYAIYQNPAYNLIPSLAESPLKTFTLSIETYQQIKNLIKPDIEWEGLFNQVKITNLEYRFDMDFNNLSIEEFKLFFDLNLKKEVFDLMIKLSSADYFKEMYQLVEAWEHESQEIQLKQIFYDIKESHEKIKQSFINTLKEHFSEYSFYDNTDSILEKIFNSYTLLSEEARYHQATQLQDLSSILLYNLTKLGLIEAKSLWHISQAHARNSNRTISLMGMLHANSSSFPGCTEGLFSKDISLVTSLKKIGYIPIGCIPIETLLLKIHADDNSSDIDMVEVLNDFASQVSEFILKWISIGDDEVRELLLAQSVEGNNDNAQQDRIFFEQKIQESLDHIEDAGNVSKKRKERLDESENDLENLDHDYENKKLKLDEEFDAQNNNHDDFE